MSTIRPRRRDEAGQRRSGTVAGRRRAAGSNASVATGTGNDSARSAGLRAMSASTKWVMGIITASLVAASGFGVNHLLSQGPARFTGGPPVAVEFVTVDQENNPGEIALAEPPTQTEESDILFGSSSMEQSILKLEKVHGGGPVGTLSIEVGLVGRGPGTIRIRDIRPHIVSSQPVAQGALFLSASQGSDPVVSVSADLDAQNPQFVTEDGKPFRQSMNINLAPGERITIALKVEVEHAMVSWQAALDIVGQDKPLLVGRTADQPFTVTGRADASEYGVVYVPNFPSRGSHVASRQEICQLSKKTC